MKKTLLAVFALALVNLACRAHITTSVETLTFDVHDTTVIVGSMVTLSYSVTPADASVNELVWISSNMDFIPSGNTVNVFRSGEATIYAALQDGTLLDSCIVRANYRAQGQCGDNLWYTINKDYRLDIWADSVHGYKGSDPSVAYNLWDFGAPGDLTLAPAPWYDFADKITDLYLYNVDAIGNNAFRDIKHLYYVMVYDNVSFGDSVFLGCTNLSTLEARTSSVPAVTPSSLLLDAETGKEVAIVIVPETGLIPDFQADPVWSAANRVFTGSDGLWNDIRWTLNQSDSLRSLKLQLDYNWESTAETFILPDLDTASVLPPWHNLREQVEDLVIGSRINYIGRNVFASLTNIQTIEIRQYDNALDSINAHAFAPDITPWKFAMGDPMLGAVIPPAVVGLSEDWKAEAANFAEQTVLYVPDSTFEFGGDTVKAVDLYAAAPFWSCFNRINDRTVAIDTVTDVSATMTWLPAEYALAYILNIHKEDCIDCDTTIIIPALGGKGLIDWNNVTIPSYIAARRMPASDDGEGGMVILIEIKLGSGNAANNDVIVSATSLEPSTEYSFTRDVVIYNDGTNYITDPALSKTGTFYTQEASVPSAIHGTEAPSRAAKILRNGQLLILAPDGNTYTPHGLPLPSSL